jgi:hypothetical protein
MTKGRILLVKKFADIKYTSRRENMSWHIFAKSVPSRVESRQQKSGLYVFLFYVFIYFETERELENWVRMRCHRGKGVG